MCYARIHRYELRKRINVNTVRLTWIIWKSDNETESEREWKEKSYGNVDRYTNWSMDRDEKKTYEQEVKERSQPKIWSLRRPCKMLPFSIASEICTKWCLRRKFTMRIVFATKESYMQWYLNRFVETLLFQAKGGCSYACDLRQSCSDKIVYELVWLRLGVSVWFCW